MKFETEKQVNCAVLLTTVASVLLSLLVTYLALGESRFAVGAIPATLVPLLVAPVVSYLGFSQTREIHLLNAKLTRMVNHDTLTQLYSRSFFFEKAANDDAPERASTLMIDAHNFKSINDTFGHEVGDAALKHLSKTIKDAARKSDVVARLGGEEFGVYMVDTDYQTAMMIAEKIRVAVQENPLDVKDMEIQMSVSIGLAKRHEDDNINSVIRRADAALYDAKNTGRNRVCFAGFPVSDQFFDFSKSAVA